MEKEAINKSCPTQPAKYARKLSVPGKESLQEDLGVVLQEIADGADPADSLKKLN